MGVGHEPAQVAVAHHVLREEDEVERLRVRLPSLSRIDRRATYVSTPMIGLMPFARAAW